MNESLSQYASFWKALEPQQKISIITASALVLVGAVALFLWSQRPDMSLLFGSMSTNDASGIVEYLEEEGITYEIRAGGSAIYVPREAVYKVRMDVSSQGLVEGDGTGFEIFDRSSFGISDFIQRTNYIRAIQGELARTISQLRGVDSARVMVVIPENRLLLVDQSLETTASVFVNIGGGALSAGSVRSIQSLVANAVLGLTVANVAVVDNNGNVLSVQDDENDIMRMGNSLAEFRQNLESYFGEKVETMLEAVVGPGNVVVRVAADVEMAQVSTVEENFNDEGGVLREQISTETINSSTSSEPNRLVGDGQIENAAGQLSSTSSQNETVENEKRFEIDRVVTNRTEAPGKIQRITASVFVAMNMAPSPTEEGQMVPVPRSENEMNQLRLMVANALGIGGGAELAERITIQETVFSRSSEVTLAGIGPVGFNPNLLFDHLDQVIGGVIAVVILFVFLRLLKRARSERGPLDRIQEMRMEARTSEGSLSNQVLTPEILNGLIRQRPENVSTNLRKWLSGGGTK